MALPSDFAARVRAARGYSGLIQDDFAAAISVSKGTIKNYENDDSRPDERAEAETVRRLAKASGLREWFFTVPNLQSALVGGGSAGEISERLGALETSIRRLEAALTRQPVDAAHPVLPGALGHVISADPTTAADPERTRNPRAGESAPGNDE